MSMQKNGILCQKFAFLPFLLFLLVNGLFVFKYSSRTSFSSFVVLVLYVVFVSCFLFLTRRKLELFSEKKTKCLFWCLLSVVALIIFVILNKIDPYSVRVDRWSAVTFFLDYLFRGEYPYGASTHVSATNFPSPFPVWYLINLPFYCLGDVGYNLVFFLFFVLLVLRYYFGSYKPPLFFLCLLLLSPAYWWEILVRSDSLSNAFLVFGFILLFSKKGYTLFGNFWLSVLCCGLLASTRLSALLPLALYFFKSYTKLPLKQMLFFPLGVLLVVFITFSPFVFWDTETWIFFTRNPFMSQGGAGNVYVLCFMVVMGVVLSFLWKNMFQFFLVATVFIFVFFVLSQIFMTYVRTDGKYIFSFEVYDISYFTLMFPYCLCAMICTTKIACANDKAMNR